MPKIKFIKTAVDKITFSESERIFYHDTLFKGFEGGIFENLREIVSRLGVSDVRAFGLTWEDCEQFLNKLGYVVKVEIVVN